MERSFTNDKLKQDLKGVIMKKKVLAVAFLAMFMYVSGTVMALDPLGPPVSELMPQQWSFGVEHVRSDMEGDWNVGGSTGQFSGLSWEKTYAKFSMGAMENVDVFLRAGLGQVETQDNGPIDADNGDQDLAWGWGAKATIMEKNDVKWGVIFQMSWAESTIDAEPGDAEEVDFDEIQLAFGGATMIREDLCFYGGPFLYWFDGEYKEQGNPTIDLEEDDMLGAFAGVNWHISGNTHLNLEFQYACDATAVAGGITWMF